MAVTAMVILPILPSVLIIILAIGKENQIQRIVNSAYICTQDVTYVYDGLLLHSLATYFESSKIKVTRHTHSYN